MVHLLRRRVGEDGGMWPSVIAAMARRDHDLLIMIKPR